MIRTKAKGLLLSIALIMVCFCFFACKETKVKVSDIEFTEQSISMLVGDEYTPTIKILPSYANDRSYTLYADDVTVLEINGGTIKALKSAVGVKLKVVSNENKNLNDIITVNIYDESVGLETPSNLMFGDDGFSFVAEDSGKASSYMLKIGSHEINIGNNVDYGFDKVAEKLGDIYNQVLTCQVKAVGDGKIFNDSQYSDGISFVKLGKVADAYVENETLYFNAIQNIGSYSVDVICDGRVVQTKQVTNSTYQAKKLSLNISDLTDSKLGAEYVLEIIPNIGSYNYVGDIKVSSSGTTKIDYTIIGAVSNVSINDKVITWDFVKNAQSYTVELYKNSELLNKYENVVSNFLNVEYNDAGEYSCLILANSTKNNTTTGKTYSDRLNFVILNSPEVQISNNRIAWNTVSNAEGYLVTIKDNSGATIINKKFVLNTWYDVSGFSVGEYNIQVVACGNGQDVMSSRNSSDANWAILNKLQLSIENEKLCWIDSDSNTLNKYNLKFETNDSEQIELELTNSSYNDKYYFDSNTNHFVYDLSSYNFEPNNYVITLQSVGENNVFDANINEINLTKLADGSIVGMQNKVISVAEVNYATSYEIAIYNSSDVNCEMPIKTLEAIGDGKTFNVDDSILGAGTYLAKVFVYGNGSNVLDANNGNNGTVFEFRKLDIPTLTVDKDNLKLIIGNVDYANGYRLFENGTNKAIDGQEFSINDLIAGDYNYTVQAIGDNATILDSAKTVDANSINIKKLATPTILFDKNTLMYTISCDDENYVADYTFTLNDVNFMVINGKVDCSTQMTSPIDYCAKVFANPVQVSADYDLVIKSNLAQHDSSKLDGKCEFKIIDGKLVVTPVVALSGSDYSLQLRIENGAEDIELSDFIYRNSSFQIDLYDEKYDIIDTRIASLLENPKDYTLYTKILENDDTVVDSNEEEIDNKLTILNRVGTIAKNLQTIEFDIVENATSYIAIITISGEEHYIDLAGQYNIETSKNVLLMDKLIHLMELNNVDYIEQTEYTISFVSVSNDVNTLINKGIAIYSFEFLKSLNIVIVEKEGTYIKQVAIENDEENASMYNVYITQGGTEYEATYMKSNDENTYADLDGITRFVGGEVKIQVKSIALTGDYFESKYNSIMATKLDSTEIRVAEGLLQWNAVDNAKQYNLVYSHGGELATIELYEGVENFTISEGKCTYDFDLLPSGLTDLYLQIDSELNVGEIYYLNSNNGTTFEDVYKLPTLDINVVNGQVNVEIRNADLSLTSKVELLIDEQVLEIDITQKQEGIVLDLSSEKLSITISPVILLKYGVDSLLLEKISLKLYSNNEKTLNSSVATKGVYGLLKPQGLNITTSTTNIKEGVINEVLEKITWNNPRANSSYVVRYEIVINYQEEDYIFNSYESAFMMPTYYDANGNHEFDKGEDANNNGELDEDEDTNNNGKLDEGEIEFGAGVYTIKVRAITDNCDNILNSQYCDEITITILETPTALQTQDGNVTWSSDVNVEYYLIKVYLLTNDGGIIQETLMVSGESRVNEFDLCNFKPFDTGVYGITVQAMHNNPRILASKESEILQVVRLPQVTNYYVKDGEFYINVHSFFTKAEIYLTDNKAVPTTYTYTIENKDLSKFEAYIEDMKSWTESDIINTYTDESYFRDEKYVGEDEDGVFRTALAQGYSIQVKLYGNSADKTSIISGHASTAFNIGLPVNADGSEKNIIDKLVTPTIEVSEAERGMLLFDIPDGLNYTTLSYYKDDAKALRGVHLYHINIYIDKEYTMYVAEIFNQELFENSLRDVDSELIQDGEDKHYLKHFEYNDITFNVIDENDEGYIPFDFNVDDYYYYSLDGIHSVINLKNGGSFVVNVRFLGDDTQFVKSNFSEKVTIKRYNVLNLSIRDGVMSWLNQATVDDQPIYLVTLVNETETYNLVLYNPNVYPDKSLLLACLDPSKKYIFDTIMYSTTEGVEDQYITYSSLADAINKARKENGSELVGTGGVFLTSVQAHYTDKTATDIILAQGVESKTIAVLPETQLNVKDGALSWNLSYMTNSGGKEYIYNYLLQVFNRDEHKLYEIKLDASNYNCINYVATYQVPSELNNGEDSVFNFESGGDYIFKLVALAGDSNTYINSIATTTDTTNILPNLQDVRMENGILTWTNTTTNNVEIYITYMLGDAIVEYITYKNGNTFELPASFTDTSGTTRQFVAGYNYNIKIRLHGTNTALNGFFSDEIITQRLATIPKDLISGDGMLDIATDNGVLTWREVKLPGQSSNDEIETIEEDGAIEDDGIEDDTNQDGSGNIGGSGVKYSIRYTLENLTTGEITDIQTNKYDLKDLPSGIILVQIIAHHDKYFSSFASQTVELFKLVPPTNIKFNEGTTTISWDKAIDRQGNKINNYRVIIMEEGKEPFEENCNSNEWVISGVSSTNFSIAVKSIDVSENGAVINSDYTQYHQMKLPDSVDVTTFVFDTELQAFKWKAIEEDAGDKYYIAYNYFEPNSNTSISVDPIQVTISREVNGEKYYFYYPYVIGRYTSIYVQVVRAESLSSQPTYCKDKDGDFVLNFNLFTRGDGISEPYVISNETQLRNIKYFLNSKYELDANIALSSSEPITTSEQVFTGTLNGNNKYIYGVSNTSMSTLSSSGYIGLFNKVAGATFTNIQLSGFEIKGYLGSNSLYMGVLVGYASELRLNSSSIRKTTFNNIVVTATTITLTKDNQTGYVSNDTTMYIGAIVGYVENGVFTDCAINLGNTSTNITLYIKGDSFTKVSLGAIAGFADNCNIANTNSTSDNNAFNIRYSLVAVEMYIPVLNLGALVGEVGENDVVLSGNSCEYTVYTSQGQTTYYNEIGNKN